MNHIPMGNMTLARTPSQAAVVLAEATRGVEMIRKEIRVGLLGQVEHMKTRDMETTMSKFDDLPVDCSY